MYYRVSYTYVYIYTLLPCIREMHNKVSRAVAFGADCGALGGGLPSPSLDAPLRTLLMHFDDLIHTRNNLRN